MFELRQPSVYTSDIVFTRKSSTRGDVLSFMLPFERIGNHTCRADFATARARRVGVEVGVAFGLYHRTGSAFFSSSVSRVADLLLSALGACFLVSRGDGSVISQ